MPSMIVPPRTVFVVFTSLLQSSTVKLRIAERCGSSSGERFFVLYM